jgi:hypothetical protein
MIAPARGLVFQQMRKVLPHEGVQGGRFQANSHGVSPFLYKR